MPAMPDAVTHQHLLRAMDALMGNASAVEDALARQIRPLVDTTLAVVFYDLTTVRIHGEGAADDDLRAFGMNKDTGSIARQFVLGVVQTAEGLPLMHNVHPGNVGQTKTLQGMLKTVLQRFPVQRVILVADRGLPSLGTIGELTSLADRGGRKLEFTLAVPARRYADPAKTFQKPVFDDDGLAESSFAGHRLIVSHDPVRARAGRGSIRDRRRDRSFNGTRKTTSEQLDLFDALNLPKPACSPHVVTQTLNLRKRYQSLTRSTVELWRHASRPAKT